MKMDNDIKYLNFPVCLLSGIFENTKKVMNDIIDYAIYKHSLKLELSDETGNLESSAKYFGINLGNSKRTYKNGKLLYDSIPEKTPMTGINKEMLFDYFEHEKSEIEIVTLLAFLAIKSILGTKPYSKANKQFLLSRMSGNAKKDGIISDQLSKYLLRYHFDKIIIELKLNWRLVYYSYHTRGFYISFDLSLEKLIEICETDRKSTKIKNMKNNENEIRKKVMENLKL